MKRKILTVEDTFLIQGRGLVIVAQKTQDFIDLKVGDQLEIINPDETFIITNVRGIEFISRRNFNENGEDFKERLNRISFLIGDNVEKSQISSGATIWLSDAIT